MLEIQKMLSAGIQNLLCSSMPGKKVKGGGTIQLGKHEALEFFFVIRGESRFQIEDKVFDTRPGDMCVIEPWAVRIIHGLCRRPSGRWPQKDTNGSHFVSLTARMRTTPETSRKELHPVIALSVKHAIDFFSQPPG